VSATRKTIAAAGFTDDSLVNFSQMSFEVRSRWTPTIAAVLCGSVSVTWTVLFTVELTVFDVLPPGGPTGSASLSPLQICPWSHAVSPIVGPGRELSPGTGFGADDVLPLVVAAAGVNGGIAAVSLARRTVNSDRGNQRSPTFPA
jgi:hypothetical protein